MIFLGRHIAERYRMMVSAVSHAAQIDRHSIESSPHRAALLFGDQIFIRRQVEQRGKIRFVLDLHFDHPSAFVRLFVDEFG